MNEILNDIQNLEKVKTFMLRAVMTNDESSANLDVALDTIKNIITQKENIVTTFETRMEE